MIPNIATKSNTQYGFCPYCCTSIYYINKYFKYLQALVKTDRCVPPTTGYLVTISFDGTSLDDVNISSDVTTINMSNYFTDHPLVNTLYTISVSVLSEEGRSDPLSIMHGNVCICTCIRTSYKH